MRTTIQTAKSASTGASQATWFINASTGSDSATGIDSAHAIKTIAELFRRVPGLTFKQNTVVTLETAIPSTDQLCGTLVASPYTCTITPAASSLTVLHTGTLSAVTPAAHTGDRATDHPNIITDGALDFSPYVGKKIRITSSTVDSSVVGAIATIASARSAGVAWTDTWFKQQTATSFPWDDICTPSASDHYEILDLPEVYVGQLSVSGGVQRAAWIPAFLLDKVALVSDSIGQISSVDMALELAHCSLAQINAGGQATYAVGCSSSEDGVAPGVLSLVGGSFIGGPTTGVVSVTSGCRLYLDADHLTVGATGVHAYVGAVVEVGQACCFETNGAGIKLAQGATLLMDDSAGYSRLWGNTGTGHHGVKQLAGSIIHIPSTDTATVSLGGSLGAVDCTGVAKEWTDASYMHPTTGAAIICPTGTHTLF